MRSAAQPSLFDCVPVEPPPAPGADPLLTRPPGYVPHQPEAVPAERGGRGWSNGGGTAVCNACGQTWARDPALEVACPICRAGVGAWCKRPSGHRAMRLHPERDGLALREGKIPPCPKAPKGQNRG